MKRIIVFLLVIRGLFLSLELSSQDISLPAPDKRGGKPLMQALDERESCRTFSDGTITDRQLSDLLWAAWGINRPGESKRTAPSARNFQEIDIYVTLPTGFYLYDAASHALKHISNKDIRGLTGTQDFVGKAPLNLVYVADCKKTGKEESDEITDTDLLFSYANTGFIAQNVYLYCASSGLGCVVRGLIPKEQLAPVLGLRKTQKIILAQTIGVKER